MCLVWYDSTHSTSSYCRAVPDSDLLLLLSAHKQTCGLDTIDGERGAESGNKGIIAAEIMVKHSTIKRVGGVDGMTRSSREYESRAIFVVGLGISL